MEYGRVLQSNRDWDPERRSPQPWRLSPWHFCPGPGHVPLFPSYGGIGGDIAHILGIGAGNGQSPCTSDTRPFSVVPLVRESSWPTGEVDWSFGSWAWSLRWSNACSFGRHFSRRLQLIPPHHLSPEKLRGGGNSGPRSGFLDMAPISMGSSCRPREPSIIAQVAFFWRHLVRHLNRWSESRLGQSGQEPST